MFPSREALTDAAVRQIEQMHQEPLDESTIQAINEADAQADRGEGFDLDSLRMHWEQRIGSR